VIGNVHYVVIRDVIVGAKGGNVGEGLSGFSKYRKVLFSIKDEVRSHVRYLLCDRNRAKVGSVLSDSICNI